MKFHSLSSIFKNAIVVISMLSIGINAHASEKKEKVDMDPRLYDYYQRCEREIKNPKVLKMLDTLSMRAKEIGDNRTVVAAECQKAMHYYKTESNHDSLRMHTKNVQRLAIETDQMRYYFWIWMRYAEYYIKHRQYNLAMIELKQMLKEAKELNNNEGVTSAYKVLARIYHIRKDYPHAEEMQLKAIRLTESSDSIDNFNLSNSYSRLASFLLAQKKYNQALTAINKALELAPTESQTAGAYQQMATYYYLCKDLPGLRKVIADLENSDNESSPHIILLARQQEAMLSENYPAAESTLLKLRDNRFVEEDVYLRQMADILSKIPGRENESIGFYKRYLSYSDSVNTVFTNGALEEFTTIMNLQNAEIEKKDMAMSLESDKNRSLVICLLGCILIVAILFFILIRQGLRHGGKKKI